MTGSIEEVRYQTKGFIRASKERCTLCIKYGCHEEVYKKRCRDDLDALTKERRE